MQAHCALVFTFQITGNRMKYIVMLLGCFSVSVASTNALAQSAAPSALQVRSWAAGCANCHGTNGNAEPGHVSLAGQNADLMLKNLLDFKEGRRPATLMHQLAKGYSDAELKAIATYFAAQKN
jgi:sulfide dehydrogenase cytochrome subunit